MTRQKWCIVQLNSTNLGDIGRLVSTYHARAEGWKKEKAFYEVYDEAGGISTVKLHYYSHEDVGKVEFKVKERGDTIYAEEFKS